jgi:hypothetical protein
VSRGQIDDAASAKEAPDAARHLPRFVQLLAGQAAGVTHGARDAIEQRSAWKPFQIAIGEASFGRGRKCHRPPAILFLSLRGFRPPDAFAIRRMEKR